MIRKLTHWRRKFRCLHRDQRGATMIEYALMLALIAMVSVFPVTRVGDEVRKMLAASGAQLAAMVDAVLSAGGNGGGRPHDPGQSGDPHDPGQTGDPH